MEFVFKGVQVGSAHALENSKMKDGTKIKDGHLNIEHRPAFIK
jgi:hypothetical protein